MISQLEIFLDQCLRREFAFGHYDCGLFVGEWVDRIAGSKLVAEVYGKYKSPDDLQRLIGNWRNYAARKFREVGFAQLNKKDEVEVGDVVELATGFGIVGWNGRNLTIVTPNESGGISHLPLTYRRGRAFRWTS